LPIPSPVEQTIEATPEKLRRFIGHLVSRYDLLRKPDTCSVVDPSVVDERLDSLTLAEAAIRHHDLGGGGARPPQIAVLGPTQTGKSTIVNVLLGGREAEVSPLAGFTVHPHGFRTSPAEGDAAWMSGLFPGWQRCEPSQLTRDDLRAYALTIASPLDPAPNDTLFDREPVLPSCVIWDTPDIDSLTAREYMPAALEVAALADVYLLVLSKEKYSDLSVWRLLDLVAPLRRRLLICVNKMTSDAEQTVVESLRARLAERGPTWGEVSIIPLPYDDGLVTAEQVVPASLASRLRSAVRGELETVGNRAPAATNVVRAAGARALLAEHWDAWVAPVRAEHAALGAWRELVEAAADKFMKAYNRDYLDHAQRYDSFRRAALELLNLLEIPRVGDVIARARRLATWPARKLLSTGRSWWRDRKQPTSALHSLGVEAGVLVDTLDTLLTGLQREAARRCSSSTPGAAVWRALDNRLRQDEPQLRHTFENAIQAHHVRISNDIRAAARRLFEELRKHPGRLTALRTARATIDVGYLLLAVKTGGLTPLDAVWAPATFGATSLMMEAIAGLEMEREARELKARQKAAVRREFVDRILVTELHGVAESLDEAGLFATTADQLDAAAQALQTWEAGHE